MSYSNQSRNPPKRPPPPKEVRFTSHRARRRTGHLHRLGGFSHGFSALTRRGRAVSGVAGLIGDLWMVGWVVMTGDEAH